MNISTAIQLLRDRITAIDVKQGRGFTLVELLVAISIFSVVVVGMFSFLWGMSGHWQASKDTSEISDNARIGLNRMTRELKQASLVTSAGENTITFVVDFGSGSEKVSYGFAYTAGGSGYVWRNSSVDPEQVTLMNGVRFIKFDYYGSDYVCDNNSDGVVSYGELDTCTTSPESKIARVDINLGMENGPDSYKSFYGQAWLRNRTVT